MQIWGMFLTKQVKILIWANHSWIFKRAMAILIIFKIIVSMWKITIFMKEFKLEGQRKPKKHFWKWRDQCQKRFKSKWHRITLFKIYWVIYKETNKRRWLKKIHSTNYKIANNISHKNYLTKLLTFNKLAKST